MTLEKKREETVVRRELGLGAHGRIEYDDDGWDSRVYVVNRGEAVFKFPRSLAAKLQYRRELKVLEALRTMNSAILIPRVEWRDADLEWFVYLGKHDKAGVQTCLDLIRRRLRSPSSPSKIKPSANWNSSASS